MPNGENVDLVIRYELAAKSGHLIGYSFYWTIIGDFGVTSALQAATDSDLITGVTICDFICSPAPQDTWNIVRSSESSWYS